MHTKVNKHTHYIQIHTPLGQNGGVVGSRMGIAGCWQSQIADTEGADYILQIGY